MTYLDAEVVINDVAISATEGSTPTPATGVFNPRALAISAVVMCTLSAYTPPAGQAPPVLFNVAVSGDNENWTAPIVSASLINNGTVQLLLNVPARYIQVTAVAMAPGGTITPVTAVVKATVQAEV